MFASSDINFEMMCETCLVWLLFFFFFIFFLRVRCVILTSPRLTQLRVEAQAALLESDSRCNTLGLQKTRYL